jgi:hypothetical protein
MCGKRSVFAPSRISMDLFAALDNQMTAKDIPGFQLLLSRLSGPLRRISAGLFTALDEPIAVKNIPGFQFLLTPIFTSAGKRGEAAMRLPGRPADQMILF